METKRDELKIIRKQLIHAKRVYRGKILDAMAKNMVGLNIEYRTRFSEVNKMIKVIDWLIRIRTEPDNGLLYVEYFEPK